jgi:plasmid stabilization system protein ParE
VQVYFTRAAREDLITTWAQIAEDKPQAADRVLDRLEGAANRLAESPQIGPDCVTSSVAPTCFFTGSGRAASRSSAPCMAGAT